MTTTTHRTFVLEVDGIPFLVTGNPNMDDKTRDALKELAKAVWNMTQEELEALSEDGES